MQLPIEQLERYTADLNGEVLLVVADIEGEADEILVFRGYSSSLMRPTAADPNVPVLPEEGKIMSISRLQAPYNPQAPRLIESDISWPDFSDRFLS